jgi:hypothetical protein
MTKLYIFLKALKSNGYRKIEWLYKDNSIYQSNIDDFNPLEDYYSSSFGHALKKAKIISYRESPTDKSTVLIAIKPKIWHRKTIKIVMKFNHLIE